MQGATKRKCNVSHWASSEKALPARTGYVYINKENLGRTRMPSSETTSVFQVCVKIKNV